MDGKYLWKFNKISKEQEKKMEKKTIRKIKWFWSWQDNKREEWLQQISLKGWHLESIGMRGLAFTLKKGEPREYTYRLDFRVDNKEKMRDYVEFIEDAGWKHIENYDGWQYFRKATEKDEDVELFTDFDSRVQKYKRLRGQLAVSFPGVGINDPRIFRWHIADWRFAKN
jgi:hypothetical protein